MGTLRKESANPQNSTTDLGYSVLRKATHVRGYVVDLEFEDGLRARVDLQPFLKGPVFEPLLDIEEFKAFDIDPAFGVLFWKDQADIAPETLYEAAKKASLIQI